MGSCKALSTHYITYQTNVPKPKVRAPVTRSRNNVPVNPEKSTGFCRQTRDSKSPFRGSLIKIKVFLRTKKVRG